MGSGTDQGQSTDDLDLSRVIADSISSLADANPSESQHIPSENELLQNRAIESELSRNELQPTQAAHAPPDTNDTNDTNDDLDLENAIGNVFSQFQNEQQQEKGLDQEQGLDHHQGLDHDVDHQEHHQDQQEYPQPEHESLHPPEQDPQPQPHPQDPSVQESYSEYDADFDDAIGLAFRDAMKSETETETKPTEEITEDADLDDAIGNAFKNLLEGTHSPINEESGHTEHTEHEHTEHEHTEHTEQPEHTELPEHTHTEQPHIEQPQEHSEHSEHPEHPEQNEYPEHNETQHSEDHESEMHQEQHDGDDDDQNLEDAIGNAFNDIFQNNVQSKPENQTETTESHDVSGALKDFDDFIDQEHKQDNEAEKQEFHEDNDDELDLNAAIGNAFKSILPEHQPEQEKPVESHPEISQEKETESEQVDDDFDLQNAIGEAFKSITDTQEPTKEPIQEEEPHQREVTPADTESNEPVDDDELSAMISASFKEVMSKKPEPQEAPDEDNFIHSAITDAFASAMKKPQETFQAPTPTVERRASEAPVDLSKLVKNLVQKMASQEDPELPDKLPISQEVLKELALEITSQVQDHLAEDDTAKKQTIKDIPQIEENVLAHFQNEAHKDEFKAKINPAALEQVVRNVIKSTDQNERQPEQSADLEKLQMNDILQNAFMMAMENPHDLLEDLEMDEDLPSSKPKYQEPNPADLRNVFPAKSQPRPAEVPHQKSKTDGPLSLQTTTIESSSASKPLTPEQPKEPKSLSIAETLALHRSSMTNRPRRDYSTIESLEEALKSDKSGTLSAGPIRSQISNVISSITSRMKNSPLQPPSDNNLLGAIRQMTNMLSSGSSFNNSSLLSILRETPSVTEIISTYKEIEEKENMVKSLMLARNFLTKPSSVNAPQNSKAAELIENVISKFNAEKSNSKVSLPHLPNIKSEVISNISKSVVSAISNYSSAQSISRTTVSGKEKLKADENLREKIRVENRARKKRWREENSERNKDNDLRSRVWKRAAILFGEKDSPEKKDWADKEFEKRKEKRMARQEKAVKPEPEDSTHQDSVKDEDLASDPMLIKPVTDIFNILSGFTQSEEPQVALAATSAATATAAAIYASNKKMTDFEQVDSAVSLILSGIMEKINTFSQHQRIAGLTRGISGLLRPENTDSQQSTQTKSALDTGGVFSRVSSAIGQGVGLPDFSHLNLSEKRKPDTILSNEPKKVKLDDSTNKADSLIGKSSSLAPHWNSTLKMPQYKKPESSSYGPKPFSNYGHPTLSISKPSPFISNKANFGLESSNKPASTGLRKPGSFQKPAAKPERSKGYGFPPLYTSHKSS